MKPTQKRVSLSAKDMSGMEPTIWAYLGIVVAILILLWAVLEMRTRVTRRSRKKPNAKAMNTMNTWIKLDSTPVDAVLEEQRLLSILDDEEDEQEEEAQHNLHIRAQQNGHYSQSKKPL